MRERWLNTILKLTNLVYQKRESATGRWGWSNVKNIFALVWLKTVLFIVSLPLYFTISPNKVTAYFTEKGGYAKIAVDYNLRRVLTETGVGIIALFLAIKLLLILFFPLVYGPLQLYSVSGLKPAEILNQSLITTEVGIQTARIVSTTPRPELSGVIKKSGSDYTFLGTGQPNSMVVLLLSDISSPIYTTEVDKNGGWQIDHNQSSFKLSEGSHQITIFSYDSKSGTRSESASAQSFKVTPFWFDSLVQSIDILTSSFVIMIILFGVFLIFLTI